MPLPKVYTVEEAADLLKLHPDTVYQKVREGTIKKADLGGWAVRITESELARLLNCEEQH